MKSENFVHQHPPTPPNLSNELQYGLQHVIQHNAEQTHALEHTQLQSRQGSAYDSPEPLGQEGLPLQPVQQYQDTQRNDLDLGIPYGEYEQGGALYQNGLNGLPHCKQNNQGVFPTSPPTPRSTTETSETGRRTRSGRSIALSTSPAESKPRAKTPPKSKKSKATKADKPKTPKLTAPLSILTKDMSNVPVRNMEEWVNRSVEERRKEVEKRNGYVTRPMNSFMLYRSAYAERTKQWCLQNNHQVVSSVSGESWPLEPSEIRDMYNEYAKVERINHQNAHPTYKFSPSKTTAPARKRKGDYSDEEEPSDLDDAEWDPSGQRQRGKSTRRLEMSEEFTANSMNPGPFANPFGPHYAGMTHRSAWNINNPGRPMPMPILIDQNPIEQTDMYHQYYQEAIHSTMGMGGVEDLRLHRVDTPGASMQFSQGQSLLGLPGGNANDLMPQLHSNGGTPLEHEHQVDPMLLAYDGASHHDVNPHLAHHPELSNGHIGVEGEFDQDSVHALLGANPVQEEYHAESWQAADPAISSLEQGSEFDKWMDDHQ